MARVDAAQSEERKAALADVTGDPAAPLHGYRASNSDARRTFETMDGRDRIGSRTERRGTILAFGLYDWDTYWQTRQQVLSRLARRGWRVGYTTPAMSIWEREDPRWRDSAWLSRAVDRDGVRIRYPGRIPTLLHRSDAWDRWIIRRHAREFASAMPNGEDRCSIAYVFHPSFWRCIEALPSCRVVYHADDRFTRMAGSTAELADFERALCKRADRIFAVTPGIADALGKAAAGKTFVIPNGADAEAYGRACNAPAPPELATIPRPRVGYAGSLNEKIDFALIARLARARPGVHWVLIGFVGGERQMSSGTLAALGECRRLVNVHFIGQRDYRELPPFCAHVDANAMFYRTDGEGWWRDIYPLKLHECLATGRPLISTDIAAVREFARVVAICRSDAEWLEAVDSAVAGRGAGSARDRIAVAAANTWEHRVDEIEAHLGELCERGPSL